MVTSRVPIGPPLSWLGSAFSMFENEEFASCDGDVAAMWPPHPEYSAVSRSVEGSYRYPMIPLSLSQPSTKYRRTHRTKHILASKEGPNTNHSSQPMDLTKLNERMSGDDIVVELRMEFSKADFREHITRQHAGMLPIKRIITRSSPVRHHPPYLPI